MRLLPEKHVLLLTLVWLIAVSPADAESITFAEHIAPIVHQKCAICHRAGQSGPFELVTFEDVRDRSETIQAVVHDNYMPPWKPVNTEIRYANDRRLTTEERGLLDRWIEAGTPAGDLATVQPPEYEGGWSLGQPDLILTMDQPFQVPASGPDIYRSFVFPAALTQDRWVKAVEVRPSARGVVHHALFFTDQTGTAREDDGKDGQPGFKGMNFLRAGGFRRVDLLSTLSLGGYVPGAMPNRLPGDLAMSLPKGSDIVMQTHFHPSGKAEAEQTQLALYFADEEPSRQLTAIQLPPLFGRFAGIDVAPGDSDFEISQTFTLPIDVEGIVVGGHAHYICREMELTAKLPGSDTITVLKIDDWDLDWQDQYQFEQPLQLPAGTELNARIVYDNSADNPENPFSPPERIRWGRESTDEMGSITLRVVAADEAERPQLQRAVRQMLAQSFNGWSGGRQGVALGQMLMRRVVDRRTIQFLDANGDGKLQSAELPERIRQPVLRAADTNGDSVVDEKELDVALKRLERFRNEAK